jgi:hypothetical protein
VVVTGAVVAVVMAEAVVEAATMEVVEAITEAAITAVATITAAATGEAAAATGAVAEAIRTTTTDLSHITMAMALSTPIRRLEASPSSLDFDRAAPLDSSVQFEFRTLLVSSLAVDSRA